MLDFLPPSPTLQCQQYGSSPYTSQHSTSYILSLCCKIRLVSSVNYKTYLLHLISCDANRILGLAWSDTPARTINFLVICEINFDYTTQAELDRHLRAHSDFIQCDECDEKLSTKND